MTLAQLVKRPPYILIIRAAHCRGEDQAIAMRALKARGLRLSDDQKQMALGVIEN